jgi:DNA-binding NarL/FixJ family response regulator
MKIAIIERFPIVQHGISDIFRSSIEETELVGWTSSQELLRAKGSFVPDLIMFCINNLSNIECLVDIEIMMQTIPGVIIIALDDRLDRYSVSEFFAKGVQGYLTKLDEISELKKCIAEVTNGKRYIASETIIRLLQGESADKSSFKGSKATLRTTRFRNGKRGQLSNGEQKIAHFLCMGKRTSQIAFELGRKPSTISTVKANIFRKLDISNIVDLRMVLNME